jgi:hypothetical protein
VRALLAHVHFDDAARPEQEAAIRAWLHEHQLAHTMTYTLERPGFGSLLDDLGPHGG